ncbi:hypothetical protein HAX54_041548 [Datura stramonium]|uniref:Uncharacterized protein n=1 Tax=Datura stramonium TaxID=4076 RepID=A0ABS8RNW5_DATST|nr:hypothetical protein [Datura stramonium]
MQASPVVSLSSSFTRCSNTNLTEIVFAELKSKNSRLKMKQSLNLPSMMMRRMRTTKIKIRSISPISADEIFHNGQIRPIFPILTEISIKLKRRRIQSRFDLEGIPPGTYCVWRPRSAEESPSELCKKSNSTGSSSKRWKLRDFLHRSNSDGKETFVFLTTPFKKREEKAEKTRTDTAKITRKVTGVPVVEGFPAMRCSKPEKLMEFPSLKAFRRCVARKTEKINGSHTCRTGKIW